MLNCHEFFAEKDWIKLLTEKDGLFRNEITVIQTSFGDLWHCKFIPTFSKFLDDIWIIIDLGEAGDYYITSWLSELASVHFFKKFFSLVIHEACNEED
jgi:hypothetical protein